MSTHPSHRFTETYICERRNGGEWIEVVRVAVPGIAVEYVRNNTPAFSPWRIVRLRTTSRSEVLQEQEIDARAATSRAARPADQQASQTCASSRAPREVFTRSSASARCGPARSATRCGLSWTPRCAPTA